MRRNIADRKFSACTQTDLLDVSIWVTTQRRGSVDMIDTTVKSRDVKKEWHTSLKEIGIFLGGSLIMQTVIGPGIFTSPKQVVSGAGSVGLTFVIWAVCGVFSTCAALCFSELQIFVRRAGCEYGYIHKAFGPLPAFIYTWMRIGAAEPCTTAVFAKAFASYISDLISDACGPPAILHKLLAALAIITLSIVNAYNVQLARQMISVSNLAKVITIGTIIVCGIYNISSGKTGALGEGFKNTESSHDHVIFAVYNSMWAYGGWSNVPSVTAGVKKPPKNLPRLVKIIIPTVMIIYLSTVTSYFTILTPEEITAHHWFGVTWGRKMLGGAGFIIPVGVAFVALGNANNTIIASGRLSSISAEDGYVPEFLTYRHVRTKSHIPAIIMRAIAAIIMATCLSSQLMVRFWIFTVWLFHGLAIFGLIVMRIRKPHLPRPYKVNILIPIFVTLGAAYLVVAPLTVFPLEGEFIFTFAVAGSAFIFYIPLVRWSWNKKITDYFTLFFQLFMEIIPDKRFKKRTRQKKSRRPASIAPMTTLAPIEEMLNEFDDDTASIHRIGRQDSQDNYSADFDDIFTVATYDTMGSIDDLESMDGTIDDSVSNFSSSPSSDQNSPPPRYEESFDFVTKL
ncbi:b(0,+)-type amino acid transporter 1-like isoform X2 [Crassostrea virginica]|uniref:B(0,+)-type amino acid transporter 1-like n=1 Tax=Crassostrea virginica TaxID=6565 RepID=A0A8B8ELA5_CRAVI|nr:b(0,+)-type amino acid transporter 1-like [Crassostrea virginica]